MIGALTLPVQNAQMVNPAQTQALQLNTNPDSTNITANPPIQPLTSTAPALIPTTATTLNTSPVNTIPSTQAVMVVPTPMPTVDWFDSPSFIPGVSNGYAAIGGGILGLSAIIFLATRK